MMTLQARLICFLIGIVILLIISLLVRRRRLYTVYSITWFVAGASFILIGLLPHIVDYAASMLGVLFAPIAILVIVIGVIGSIVLHLSIIVSEHHLKVREFEKELSLLRKKKPFDNVKKDPAGVYDE